MLKGESIRTRVPGFRVPVGAMPTLIKWTAIDVGSNEVDATERQRAFFARRDEEQRAYSGACDAAWQRRRLHLA